MSGYQPKTGAACTCRPGDERDNCPSCEGTGQVIDFRAIRNAPLGRTPEKMGRCECRESRCFVESCLHTSWNDAKARGLLDDPETRCTRDAVRLVTVDETTVAQAWDDVRDVRQMRMCEPCAQHHERGEK